jgi:hypothetical protein
VWAISAVQIVNSDGPPSLNVLRPSLRSVQRLSMRRLATAESGAKVCLQGLLRPGKTLNSAAGLPARVQTPVPPSATSRLLYEQLGKGAFGVSGGFPLSNCMCIPPCGARPKL